MTTLVYKYPLHGTDPIVVLPTAAEVLYVGAQNDVVCLWARVPRFTIGLVENRQFHVVCTGDPVDAKDKYHGTVMLNGGGVVLHVFEEVE